MHTETQNKVTIRLFVGCLINSELRMHLNQSKEWKQALILPKKEGKELLEVHFHGKDYIGFHSLSEKISLVELKNFEDFIKSLLQNYCPMYKIENVKISVFSQVFVA